MDDRRDRLLTLLVYAVSACAVSLLTIAVVAAAYLIYRALP